MIKKPMKQLFKNFEKVAKKLNIRFKFKTSKFIKKINI